MRARRRPARIVRVTFVGRWWYARVRFCGRDLPQRNMRAERFAAAIYRREMRGCDFLPAICRRLARKSVFCVRSSGVCGGSAKKSAEIAMQSICVFLPLTTIPKRGRPLYAGNRPIAKSVACATRKGGAGTQSSRWTVCLPVGRVWTYGGRQKGRAILFFIRHKTLEKGNRFGRNRQRESKKGIDLNPRFRYPE